MRRRERRKGRSTKGTACTRGGDLLRAPRSHLGVVLVLVLLGCGWIGHGHCCCSSGGCGSSCSCRCLAPTAALFRCPTPSPAPAAAEISLGVFGCSSCCRFCSSSCFYSCYPCCESAAAKNSWQKSRSRKQKGPAVAREAVTPAGPLPSEAPAPQGYLAYSV